MSKLNSTYSGTNSFVHTDVRDRIRAIMVESLNTFIAQVCLKISTDSSRIQCKLLKGRVMGPLLVLVSPCFRQNVIVTGKIVSFL